MSFVRIISCLSLICAALVAGTALAGEREDGPILALGDSVAFGYITHAGHEYLNAANFVGYPEYLGALLRVDVTNAGCPGETSGSFLSATAPDNGCRSFKSAFPLHVASGSTQIAFATTFLARHRDTRLVTIGVGANDVFLLESSCAASSDPTQCIEAGLPAVLSTLATNLGTILAALRGTGYAGPIVIANYYSLDYSDPLDTTISVLLNQALAAPAPAFGAAVADVFTAFKNAAANPLALGKTCNTGLLNVDPQDQTQTLCDVHPTLTGQRLIAQTVAGTYRATNW